MTGRTPRRRTGGANYGVPTAVTVQRELRAWRNEHGGGWGVHHVTLWLRTRRLEIPSSYKLVIEWDVCSTKVRDRLDLITRDGMVWSTRTLVPPEKPKPITRAMAQNLIDGLP